MTEAKSGNHVRIVVADGDGDSRQRLVQIVQELADFQIDAETSDGHAAVEAVGRWQPDLFVLDGRIKGLSAPEVVHRVTELSPETKVILIAESRDTKDIVQALKRGTVGYLLRGFDRKEFTKAVSTVMKGRVYISSIRANGSISHSDEITRDSADMLIARLSATELRILDLLVRGRSLDDVATALNIGTHTAEFHQSNMIKKFDLHGSQELIDLAIRSSISKLRNS